MCFCVHAKRVGDVITLGVYVWSKERGLLYYCFLASAVQDEQKEGCSKHKTQDTGKNTNKQTVQSVLHTKVNISDKSLKWAGLVSSS